MDLHLRHLVRQWIVVVAMSAAPVFVTAFAAVPFALGYHPGEQPPAAALGDRHPS